MYVSVMYICFSIFVYLFVHTCVQCLHVYQTMCTVGRYSTYSIVLELGNTFAMCRNVFSGVFRLPQQRTGDQVEEHVGHV